MGSQPTQDDEYIITCSFFLSSPVLFLSVVVFLCAASYVLSDNRRQLITSVKLYQPSFLYAYLALLMQGGVVQVRRYIIGILGCIEMARHAKMHN